jgi:hypothetical protein
MMNSLERLQLLRLSILQELSACGAHACPEQALCNAMYAQVNPPPTRIEILDQAKWLANEGLLVIVRPALGGNFVYRITTNGEAALHA